MTGAALTGTSNVVLRERRPQAARGSGPAEAAAARLVRSPWHITGSLHSREISALSQGLSVGTIGRPAVAGGHGRTMKRIP
jgi:hypothetical protein